jgi:colicin import membrane protein
MLSIVSEATDAPSKEPTVKKVKIDGVEYEAGSEQAVAAQIAYQTKLDAQAKSFADEQKKRDDELKAAKDAGEKAQAKADAEGERAKKLDAELKDAPKKIAAELKARMQLEAQAREVLGKKEKLDGLSDKEVKLKVLEKLDESFDAKGRSDAYIDGRYDAALELASELDEGDEHADEDDEEDGIDTARRALVEDEDDEAEPGSPEAEMSIEDANKSHADSQTAYQAMLVRHRNAWKQPIGEEPRK